MKESFKNKWKQLRRESKALYRSEKYDRALLVERKVLRIAQKYGGPKHLYVAFSLNRLGVIHSCKKRHKTAESLFQRALFIFKATRGEFHQDVAGNLYNLGLCNGDQKCWHKAEAFHSQALSIRDKVLRPNHPYIAQSLVELAKVFSQQERFKDAYPLLERALLILDKPNQPRRNPRLVRCIDELAWAYFSLRQNAKAERLFTRLVAIGQKTLGYANREVVLDMRCLAICRYALRRRKEAKQLFKQIIAIQTKALGPEHPDVAETQSLFRTFYPLKSTKGNNNDKPNFDYS